MTHHCPCCGSVLQVIQWDVNWVQIRCRNRNCESIESFNGGSSVTESEAYALLCWRVENEKKEEAK